MEQLLHRSIAAGAAAAVIGAGLIAVTPPQPPPVQLQEIEVQLTDVFSALSTNFDYIFTDTVNALTALPQLHLGSAVQDVFNNGLSVVEIAQNLIIAGLGPLTGDPSPAYITSQIDSSSDVLGTASHLLNNFFTEINLSLTALFAGNLDGAFISASDAFDTAIFAIPGEFVVGPLYDLGL